MIGLGGFVSSQRIHSQDEPSGILNAADPGQGKAPSTEVDTALVIAFVTQLRSVFSSPNYRPPLLPTVALQVHELSFRADINAEQLVRVLEQDSILAAQVLRVAGSAAFGGWSDKNISLQTAVVRLGLRNLASLVWEVATGMRVFRSARYAGMMEQIRVHSTVCAHLCRHIASRKALSTETAFLCGLLHDIGMAATLLVLSDRPKDEPAVSSFVLDEVLRQTHQEVSGMIAQLWKLPEEVQKVVANHHTFPAGEPPNPLSAVVAITEELSLSLGKGVQMGAGRCDRVWPEALAQAKEALHITPEEETELRESAQNLAEAVSQNLGGKATEREAVKEKKAAPPSPKPASATSASVPAGKVQARLSFWQRLKRSWGGK
jgi:putative nucleotidyltransferase with HDIG domain